MSGISTHVLDLSLGRPAAGVAVTLERLAGDDFGLIGAALTDVDGRVADLLPAGLALEAGRYRITFQSGAYFQATARSTFYPRIQVEFQIADAMQHYHVPLLLSPWGYSTYRGS